MIHGRSSDDISPGLHCRVAEAVVSGVSGDVEMERAREVGSW